MTYKCLMLDVDGTLSSYSSTSLPEMPSDEVVEAINRAKATVFVGLATSRPLFKVQPILERLQLDGYSILHNGALIVNSKTLEIIEQQALPSESLPMLYDIAMRYQIPTYYSNFRQNYLLESMEQITSIPVANIFYDGIEPGNIEQIDHELGQINDIMAHHLISRQENKFERSVTHVDATKQNAIEKVAQLLGIRTQDIIGVGDGPNDIPLLRACGLKVAMGNAVEELKAIADMIAPSVEENGVVTIIDQFWG